jgi:hypothetical protein
VAGKELPPQDLEVSRGPVEDARGRVWCEDVQNQELDVADEERAKLLRDGA